MKSADIYSLLGIAQRARKLISGQDSVERGVNAGKVFLIIISKGTSKHTRKKMYNLSRNKNVPILIWGNSEDLGQSIGRERRKVIGITDKGIAREISRRIKLLTGVGDIG